MKLHQSTTEGQKGESCKVRQDTPGRGAGLRGVAGGGLLEICYSQGRLAGQFFRAVVWLDFCQTAESPGHGLCCGLCSQLWTLVGCEQ